MQFTRQTYPLFGLVLAMNTSCSSGGNSSTPNDSGSATDTVSGSDSTGADTGITHADTAAENADTGAIIAETDNTDTDAGTAPNDTGTPGVDAADVLVGPTQTTVDLLTATNPCGSGQPATHDDGWLCVLHAPATGDNEMGAWYDYTWGTCGNPTFSKSGQEICFSGGPCTAGGGAGVGVSLCDIEASIATWPQWQAVATAGNIPVDTGAQGTFGQCNGGAQITGVTWTETGTTPAGMSLQFQGAATTANTGGPTLGQVTVTSGTTSINVPSTVDGTKIASLQWAFPAGAVTTNWNFCITGLKLQYN